MGQGAKSIYAENSPSGTGQTEKFTIQQLTKKQITYIKLGTIILLVAFGFIGVLPKLFEGVPDWVKRFFLLYIFMYVLPKAWFSMLDKMKKE